MSTARHIAKRMEQIRPFQVMEILARARALEAQGRDIVHMEIGEPDFVTPEPIIRAGQEALAQGKTHYTPALGLPALRQAIARYYSDRYGVTVAPERVVVTPGSSGALQLVMSVLVNPGDEVLVTDPGYPCNRHIARLVGGETVKLNGDAANGYFPTLNQLKSVWTGKGRLLMLTSPANPTGTLLDRARLREIHAFLRGRGVLVVDEIYQGLVYEGDDFTALALGDDLVVINSFSKYFGMTGWRLGWAVVPEWMVDAMDRLAQNLFLAAPTLAQHAALAAFDTETLAELDRRREIFRERRDFLLPALESLGFKFPIRPSGAFYLYADSSALGDDSQRLANALLEQAGVAVTPGMDFGRYHAADHIRFACTTDLERLREGVERIGRFLGRKG